MNVNVVVIGGTLTADPTVREANSGTTVASFGLANNRKFKGRQETTFVDCVAFGGTADLVGQHLHKGSKAIVEGRLNLNQWTDKQTGEKRKKLQIVASQVHIAWNGRDGMEETGTRETVPAGRDEEFPF